MTGDGIARGEKVRGGRGRLTNTAASGPYDVTLAQRSMELIDDENGGPSLLVIVSNSNSLFSFECLSFGDGLPQQGSDLYPQ